MREVVIVDMARSAVGRHGGTIKDVRPIDMLLQVAGAGCRAQQGQNQTGDV